MRHDSRRRRTIRRSRSGMLQRASASRRSRPAVFLILSSLIHLLSRLLHTDVGTFDLPPALPSTALAVTSTNHIPPPASPLRIGYGLNSDGTWITYRGENLLWLPPEYRPMSSAISGTAVAIGCYSGRVWTVVFSEDNPISQQG
jgi:hypothetical protein